MIARILHIADSVAREGRYRRIEPQDDGLDIFRGVMTAALICTLGWILVALVFAW